MKDLSNSWKKITMDKKFRSELERMQLYVDKMANDYKEYYGLMSAIVGEDAKLSLSAKRRNESDVQYWQRIMKNYDKINRLAQGRKIGGYYNSFFDFTALKNDLKSDLDEVMHELEKTKDDWEGQDPVSIKMAIDQQFLLRRWDETLKELVIQAANDKWQLNIPVKFNTDKTPEVPQGFRAIIATEFPKLFSEDELSNIGSVGGIVDAINGKLEEAKKNLENAYKVQNNIGKSATDYEAVLADINEQLEAEQAKDITHRDEEKINALRSQADAIANANEEFDKQIKLQRQSAQAAYDLAQAAKERVSNAMLSTVAEDVKTTFPTLLQDAIKSITDKDYNIDFTILDSDLEKVKGQADLYDLWVSKMKALADAKQKVADVRISDAAIERERAELTQKQAAAEQDLLTINQKLEDSKYQQTHEQYKRLKYNLAIATSAEDIQQAEQALNKFLDDNTDTEFASLIIQKQKLQTLLAIKKTTGELANEQIAAYNELINAQEKELQTLGERYNFKMPETTKGGGEDPFITLMKNRMSFMKDFQKGVEDLSKYMQQNLALGQEQDIMMFRGKSVDIDVKALEGSKEELIKWYDDAIAEVSKKIAKLGGKTWEGLGVQAILSKDTKSRIIKKYQELLQELFNAQTDFKTDKLKKSLEEELKRLADEVSRTKTAKEFFDKMLNMTGDRELSATITMSVYGGTGDKLFEKMKDNIVKSFSGFDISLAVDMVNEVIDYNQLEKLYKIYEKDIPEARRKGIEQMIADGKKENAENVKMWVEQLAKAKDFEQQRTDIIRAETERRNKIIKSDQDQSVKDTLLKQSFDLQGQELSKINVDEFKASEDYIKIFEDLDKVSSATIDRLIERLEALIDENRKLGGEGTEGMKTLIQAWDKLKDTKIQRGDPLEGAVSSIREYIAAKREQKTAEEELAAERTAYANQESQLNKDIIDAQQEELQAQEAVNAAKAEYLALAQQLAELEATEGTDPEQVAAMQQQVFAARQRLTTAELQQNVAITKTVKAEKEKAKAAEKVRNAEQKVTNAQDKQRTASNKFTQSISKAAEVADAMRNVIQGISDTLGVAADTDLGMAFEAGVTALQQFSSLMNTIIALQTLYNIVTESNPWIAIAAAVLTVASILGNVISNAKIKKADKEIERQQELIDALSYSYDRLQNSIDKSFGSEYIANFRKQQENLRAQIVATEKQLEAEKSKGKKKDKDKIKDYEESIRDLKDSITDLTSELSTRMLGTDLASAARSFAQSWLDAYKEFGDTRKAIEEEMQKLMENLIVESVLGAVMQRALSPVFDMIDKMGESDFYNDSFWTQVVDKMNKATDDALTGASVITAKLEKAGVNIRELGTDFTGISKDIASASEESILGLSSLVNTSLYYVSNIDRNVAQIVALMQGGGYEVASGEQLTDLITIQNQHLAYLPNIALNTAQTAERCERAAQACESIAENLNRVIKPNGVQGNYRVNTSL